MDRGREREDRDRDRGRGLNNSESLIFPPRANRVERAQLQMEGPMGIQRIIHSCEQWSCSIGLFIYRYVKVISLHYIGLHPIIYCALKVQYHHSSYP